MSVRLSGEGMATKELIDDISQVPMAQCRIVVAETCFSQKKSSSSDY